MNTVIGGKDIVCPHCKKLVFIEFDHTINNKGLNQIQDSVILKK